MYHVMARLKVSDFKAWKEAYDRGRSVRESMGIRAFNLWRSVDDPQDVVLLLHATHVDKAKAYFSSDELAQRMAAAGVTEPPELVYLADA
jgi:heme-degrading monooxygenase HmoA